MSNKVFTVLFLCTCNSARSLIAEAQLNRLGGGRFRAYSAGSFPKGEVNPLAIRFLSSNGFATQDLRSKSWDEFSKRGAPELDYVLTLCENAAKDQCPIWPGQPISAHWSVSDPAAVTGSIETKYAAMVASAAELRKRIELFVSLPTISLDRMSIKRNLERIGEI